MNSETKMRIAENGPFVAEELRDIVKSTGRHAKLVRKSTALCRCGKSEEKPFCDGTHGKIGFDDAKSPGPGEEKDLNPMWEKKSSSTMIGEYAVMPVSVQKDYQRCSE